MTIASLICLNLALLGVAYYCVNRLSGGVPAPIRIRHTDGIRRRGRD